VQADAAFKLESLLQGKLTAEGYFIEFDLLASQADLTTTHFDTYKIRLANRRLNQALVDNIHNITTLPTAWDAYKARAIQLDNNWRIGQQARNDPRPTIIHPQNQQQKFWQTKAHPDAPSYQSRPPTRDPNAMDVDTVRVAASATQQAPQHPNNNCNDNTPSFKPRPRVDGERPALLAVGACFYCREPGHMKANCPALAAKVGCGTYTPLSRPPGSLVRSTNTDIPESPSPSYAPSAVSSQDMESQLDFASGWE
jgi:hypothetical protein